MSYWIMVFNQQPVGQVPKESLVEALRSAHFDTLCAQYGLDPALIGPALDHLSLEKPARGRASYCLLRYQPTGRPPIVMTEWEPAILLGDGHFGGMLTYSAPAEVRGVLSKTREIYSLELLRQQLADMGLLLAYEIARWLAREGSGLVLGLDGVWYRVNAHQAFIPIVDQVH